MSPSERLKRDDPPSGNRKVMIYIAPEVHRAIRQIALDENRSASDVYAEAARAFLADREVALRAPPEPKSIPQTPTTVDIAEAVERQGKRIEDLHAALAGTSETPPKSVRVSANVKAAEAMKVVLELVRASGAAGIGSRDLNAATSAAGVASGTAENAKAVLREAGLLRFEVRRWYVDGVGG